MRTPHPQGADWWRSAVIYQVHFCSFAHGTGDGIGNIEGLRSRLSYLRDLGVETIWINPWYPSPMADGGCDAADYREFDPVFGTLADAEALVSEAHGLGIKVIFDIVPNHTSDRHEWFAAAMHAAPGPAERAHYHFGRGRGPDGALPPNDWQSNCGGPAWTRITEPDDRPGEWYLHLYAPEQTDLNRDNPAVRAEFEDIPRFWFDRGVDGLRIDVAHGLVRAPGLPDLGTLPDSPQPREGDHPYRDRDSVHSIFRS